MKISTEWRNKIELGTAVSKIFFKPLDMYAKTGDYQPCSLEADFPCVEMPAWDAGVGLGHIIVTRCKEPARNGHTSLKESIPWMCVVRRVIYWQISHNLNCPKTPCAFSCLQHHCKRLCEPISWLEKLSFQEIEGACRKWRRQNSYVFCLACSRDSGRHNTSLLELDHTVFCYLYALSISTYNPEIL